MKRYVLSTAILAVCALAGTASAQYNHPAFNLNVTNFEWASVSMNGAAIPAATYTTSRVRFNWTGSIATASSDAGWALTDTASTGGFNLEGSVYVNRGPAPNSAGNSNPVLLDWPQATLDLNYPGASPLHFNYRHTFSGTSGTWNNIQITLGGALPPPAPPTNDACANAISIAAASLPIAMPPIDVGGASNDPAGDPTFACAANVRRTIWYTFTPATDGQYTLSTCTAEAPGTTVTDTVVSIYTGDCAGGFTSVTCGDDSTCGTRASVITTLTAGTPYTIVVGRKGTEASLPLGESAVSLFVGPYTAPIGAPNDDCSNAIVIPPAASTGYASDVVDIINATNISEPTACATINATVWWTFRPTAAGSYTFSTCTGSTVPDTVLAVYSGACGGLVQIACNDDGGPSCTGLRASASAILVANTDYYIRIGKFGGTPPDSGASNVQLTITNFTGGVTPPTPAPNDACADAIVVPGASTSFVSVPVDVTAATRAGEPDIVTCTNNIGYSIWYRYTPTQTGDYTFSTCSGDAPDNSIADTFVALYSGPCGSLAQVACNDDFGIACATARGSARARLNAGTEYYLLVARWGSSALTGNNNTLQFAITNFTAPPTAPANDNCAGAINVNTQPGFALPFTSAAFIMTGATTNPTDPAFSCAGATAVGYTMWYSYQPSTTNEYLISTTLSDAPLGNVPDTIVSVYTTSTPGSPCSGTFTEVVCNDNGTGRARARATLNAGTRYYFMVGRKGAGILGAAENSYQFSIAIAPPAPICTVPEVEPNDGKTTATPANLTVGQTLCGNAAGETDYFLVGTPVGTAGLTRYRLSLTSDTPTHTVTLRGLTQTAGAANSASDAVLQTSPAVDPYVQWYAGGNNADPNNRKLFARVAGGTSGTSDYALTLTATQITPVDIAGGNLSAGTIEITTVGTTGGVQIDTDIWVYDGNFNPIPDFGNDDEPGTTSLGSSLSRTYVAGTYYLALGAWQTETNLTAATDDDFQAGNLTDYPGVTVTNITTLAQNRSFRITDSVGPRDVAATTTEAYEVLWFKFVVGAGGTPGPARCNAADIANDSGQPIHNFTIAPDPLVPNNGITEADYNVFFANFFDAVNVTDIADDQGIPLPPFGAGGVAPNVNNGVTEGDYNFFFSVFFSGCSF